MSSRKAESKLARKTSVKREGSSNSLRWLEESNRIRMLEVEIKALKEYVKEQEETLRELREARAADRARAMLCRAVLFAVVLLAILLCLGSSLVLKDTPLVLNVKATPETAPFLKLGVKTQFTVGDVLATARGAFGGEAGGASRTKARKDR